MESVLRKTYDLKNAYKQYGVAKEDRSLLRIAVWDPHKAQVRFLGLNALPFGAVGSVGLPAPCNGCMVHWSLWVAPMLDQFLR